MVDFDKLLTGNSCYSLVIFRALILEADGTGSQSIYLRTGYKFPGSYGQNCPELSSNKSYLSHFNIIRLPSELPPSSPGFGVVWV